MAVTSLEPELTVLPADWPGAEREGVRPGELAHFAPQGLALGAPMIVRPYGGMADPSYYGAQQPVGHPIRDAPLNDDAGGFIYFAERTDVGDLMTALGLMGFHTKRRDYAVFITSSAEPGEDRYLDQMRIVSRSALAHFYRCPADQLTDQALDAGGAVAHFIRWQMWKWYEGPECFELIGCLGGDGDWAKERIAFGAMVENAYWGIYRVWSRPWLITK